MKDYQYLTEEDVAGKSKFELYDLLAEAKEDLDYATFTTKYALIGYYEEIKRYIAEYDL